jgi:hypothetical protein
VKGKRNRREEHHSVGDARPYMFISHSFWRCEENIDRGLHIFMLLFFDAIAVVIGM